MHRIAIQPDDQLLTSGKRQSFSRRWVELAHDAGHDVRLVDVRKPAPLAQIEGCDGFMWFFAHLPFPRNLGRRFLPAIEHGLGIPVFPDWRTLWHFDDKIAQTHLLEAAKIPMPMTWVFWNYGEAMEFCRQATYPMVIKLNSGIVSENVRLLRSFSEVAYFIGTLFGAGIVSLDRASPTSPREMRRRVVAAAKMLRRGTPPNFGERMELQKGYVLLQEFLPGNDFDTRIAIIGDRAFAFRRFNRPGDFRASGSGLRSHDPGDIDSAAVRLAFRAARYLGTQSLAVDVLFRDGLPMLTEISYYYEGWLLAELPGHWTLNGGDPNTGELRWAPGKTRPEDAIFEDFLSLLDDRAA